MIFKSLLGIFIGIFVAWLLTSGDYGRSLRKIWTEKNGLVDILLSQVVNFLWEAQKVATPPVTTVEYKSTDETERKQKNNHHQLTIFTKIELSKYKGVNEGQIYLAIFGRVYDVSKGKGHYGPGGAYSFFSGIDGSRAFVTGDFTDAGLTDDVESLTSSQLADLSNWMSYYDEHYKLIGYLFGRFYDSNGRPTKVLKKIEDRIKEYQNEQKTLEAAQNILPPCNTEWKPSGSRVWCTQKSGGISRDWVGVPRQHFEIGSASLTCVCARTTEHNNHPKLKEYKGCDPLATSCDILSQ